MAVDLFTCDHSDMDYDAVLRFVTTAIEQRLQAESLVVELKATDHLDNICKAVAAMANTDGGLIFVGADERSPDAPLVGVAPDRHDAIVSRLRSKIPEYMPEVIPVKMSDDLIVLVLRVDAESVPTPVVLDGRVLKRIPGESIGARRDEVIALCQRRSGVSSAGLAMTRSGLADMILPSDADEDRAQMEFRARATFILPRRFERRDYLGSSVVRVVEDALVDTPVPDHLMAERMGHGDGRPWNSWSRTTTVSRTVDLVANRSTRGPRWRPELGACARVHLRDRLLETTVSISVWPSREGPADPICEIAEVLELLLAASWTAAQVGHNAAAEIGAAPRLQRPVLDAALRNVFSTTPIRLGFVSTKPSTRPDWSLPGVVPTDDSIEAFAAMVKEWLRVPLYEHEVLDFETELDALKLPRWAQRIAASSAPEPTS